MIKCKYTRGEDVFCLYEKHEIRRRGDMIRLKRLVNIGRVYKNEAGREIKTNIGGQGL